MVPSSVIITFEAEIISAFRQLGRPCSYPLRNVRLDALKTIRLKSLKINILFKWDAFAISVILCLDSNWFKNIKCYLLSDYDVYLIQLFFFTVVDPLSAYIQTMIWKDYV